MMGILALAKEALGAFGKIFTTREERKSARATARAKVATAKQEGQNQIVFNDQELEQLHASQKKDSWLDEFTTLSVYSIFYGVIVGSIAAAFGWPGMLEGLLSALAILTQIGVDVGFLLEAVTLASVGLVVWRKT